jgi:hypothetical protein
VSDARRREIERAASSDPAAAGRLLLERLRAGEVPRERVHLLALVGDPAACLALGLALPTDPEKVARAAAGLGWRPVAIGLTEAARRALGDERSSPLQRAVGLALQRLEQAQAAQGEAARAALVTACRAVEAMNSVLQSKHASQWGPTEPLARAVEELTALFRDARGESGRQPRAGDAEAVRLRHLVTAVAKLGDAGLPLAAISAALVQAAGGP